MELKYCMSKLSNHKIYNHLSSCDQRFLEKLRDSCNIKEYCKKLSKNALCFYAIINDEIIGLLCAYCDNPSQPVFITNLSIISSWKRKKIATNLMINCIDYLKGIDLFKIELDVNKNNKPAIRLYKSLNFKRVLVKDDIIRMSR